VSLEPEVTVEEIHRAQNRALEREVTLEEIHKAIRSLPTGKAPRLDLIPSKFFQQSWTIVGLDMVELVKEVLASDSLPKQLNTNRITLVPKSGNLSLITNYRPISLLNIVYKIIAKILAN
jgi:hypothetical protein